MTGPHALAPMVAAVARGPGRARTLHQDEARAAMTHMLGGAEPEATGALLMVLRYRGEVAAEIAGFAQACRRIEWEGIGAALDWPSYAAGRTRGAPLFLGAAKLVARAGVPVFLHGHNSHQAEGASVAAAAARLGIPICETPGAARAALGSGGIAYAPLGAIHPAFLRLLALRDALGLRSCVNTVARMSNPAAAPAAVQGVFHPPYKSLQSDAARLLGLRDLAVVKGGGGEFEVNPSKPIEVEGLEAGERRSETLLPLMSARRLHAPDAPLPPPDAVLAGHPDPFARDCVRRTAILALRTALRLPRDAAAARIDAVFPDRRTAA